MDKIVHTFELPDDPQKYTLTYDFNAFCEAEKKAGVNLMLGIMGLSMDSNMTRAVLFAMLLPAHPLVLLTEAGDLLSRDFPALCEAMNVMIRQIHGKEAEEHASATAPAVVPPEAASKAELKAEASKPEPKPERESELVAV